MKDEGVLAYWFNLDEAIQEEWADWYIRDHMPSRIRTTFTGARCFISGQRDFMALYETSSLDALVDPAYLALLRTVSDDDRRRRAWYENTTRGCCRKLADVGFGAGGVVGSVRFARGAEHVAAPAEEIAGKVAAMDRIGRVAVLEADPSVREKLDGARVTGHSDASVDLAMIVECGAEADFQRALDRLSSLDAWGRLSKPGSIDVRCYRLLYAIAT